MFTPSKFQQNIFDWIVKASGSAVISACAGSGKTTTIVEGLKFIPASESIVLLAFNKKIQLELDARIKKESIGNAQALTVHSLCFSAYKRAQKGVRLDDKKVKYLLDNGLDQSEAKVYSQFVNKLVRLAKDAGLGIQGFKPIADASAWADLIEHHELELEENGSLDRAIQISQKVLADNNLDLETIDFSDMVYLTLLKEYRLPKFDWILVDECQDLSPLRQAVVRSLQKVDGSSRTIAVGDRGQAIYGFTGADAKALDNLVSDYNATELPLSTCYRCSTSVINHAKQWYPNIEAHEDAKTGSVTNLEYSQLAEKPESLNLTHRDAILCRNNSPLLRTAFSLIKKGIGCRIEGRDIANGLLAVIGKWKVSSLVSLSERLESYLDRESQKALRKGNEALLGVIQDKVDCIRACMERCFLDNKTTVADLKALIISMFSDADGKETNRNLLTLSSAHKSKGLEWDRVFLLGRQDFMPSKWARKDWMLEQERNLIYVAVTRAKEHLVEVNGVSAYLKQKAE